MQCAAIAMRKLNKSGSVYYNYKGFFSIICLALAGRDYKFMWVDIGANGSTSDCAMFNDSELKDGFESNDTGLSPPDHLINEHLDVPYYMIGNNAFPLRTWMMKPYSKCGLSNEERISNYRLYHARRIVENAFGILANHFQCILGTMRQQLETVKSIVAACICLHNLMRTCYAGLQNAVMDQDDNEHRPIPGAWKNDAQVPADMTEVRTGNHDTLNAKRQRSYLTHYLNSRIG